MSISVTPSALAISSEGSLLLMLLVTNTCLDSSDSSVPSSWVGNPAASNRSFVASFTVVGMLADSANAEFNNPKKLVITSELGLAINSFNASILSPNSPANFLAITLTFSPLNKAGFNPAAAMVVNRAVFLVFVNAWLYSVELVYNFCCNPIFK